MHPTARTDAIIVDIDGTLCNIEHRLKHIKKEPQDWKKFYERMELDEPKQNVIKIIDCLENKYELLFVTGRPEKYRWTTFQWFIKHLPFGVTELYMRKENDFRQDDIIKREIYINEIKPHYNIIAAFEDRPRVIDMWRKLDIECFKVGAWNE